ncbi:unnamed protein product [Arctia plantaginis]|uniref:Uncharacterized protein n=1 Tax=Arctia plantaginis TaxID=874455 RepID=A0A8S0YS26_ARCPL|nr:unnamed protein product [Arctia plantaginis]
MAALHNKMSQTSRELAELKRRQEEPGFVGLIAGRERQTQLYVPIPREAVGKLISNPTVSELDVSSTPNCHLCVID